MGRPMTPKQAQKEAIKRWGKNAVVQWYRSGAMAGRKHVGVVVLGCMFEVRGQGDTWEDAFADADRKAEADKARSRAIEEGRKP